MDFAAASVGPWLFLGVVLGVLLTVAGGVAVARLREAARPSARPDEDPEQRPGPPEVTGATPWIDDDLPGFLDHPPGFPPDDVAPGRPVAADDLPLGPPEPSTARLRRPVAAPAGTAAAPAAEPTRLLLVLTLTAVLLIGAAAALAALGARAGSGGATSAPASAAAATDEPSWDVPELTPPPERPEPGDPGAGRLATASVPIGADGAFARLSFEGLVLERRAVGVTVAYPSISVTAARVPGGPALAHLRLPVWNCLTDYAPGDPVAAGCRQLPTEYADLPSPALSVAQDGDGLRFGGRFATYVRPGGSPPEWTGRVYPLAVSVDPVDDGAAGSVHLGTLRAGSVDDPRLSELRRGR